MGTRYSPGCPDSWASGLSRHVSMQLLYAVVSTLKELRVFWDPEEDPLTPTCFGEVGRDLFLEDVMSNLRLKG